MKAKQGFLFEEVGSSFCVFVGIDVIVINEDDKRRTLQLALLDALLNKADGIVSIDEIVRDLSMPFDRGGKWVGPSIEQLRDSGLIEAMIPRRSRRKPRKGGLVNVWRLRDRAKAMSTATRLRSSLIYAIANDGSKGMPSKPS